jgi:hypothetical protein
MGSQDNFIIEHLKSRDQTMLIVTFEDFINLITNKTARRTNILKYLFEDQESE